MSHTEGFGVAGIAEVVDNPKIPVNVFFTAGRQFEIRVRHTNLPGNSRVLIFDLVLRS